MLDESKKVRQVIALEEDAYPRIKQRVNAVLTAFKQRLQTEPSLLNVDKLPEHYHPEPDNELIAATYELFMKAWLLGMVHARRKQSTEFADIDYSFLDGLTFEDAIAWAKGRVTLTPAQFSMLSAQMKVHAFTVGRLTQLDMIEKAKRLYIKQLAGPSRRTSMPSDCQDITRWSTERISKKITMLDVPWSSRAINLWHLSSSALRTPDRRTFAGYGRGRYCRIQIPGGMTTGLPCTTTVGPPSVLSTKKKLRL
jgi:hypothetical protein